MSLDLESHKLHYLNLDFRKNIHQNPNSASFSRKIFVVEKFSTFHTVIEVDLISKTFISPFAVSTSLQNGLLNIRPVNSHKILKSLFREGF